MCLALVGDGARMDNEECGGGRIGNERREVLAIGIGDEDLPEAVRGCQLKDTLYAFAIELVEDIIQQEDRVHLRGGEENGLCELEGDKVRFLLPLTPHLLDGIAIEHHLQFVFMNALRRPTEDDIAASGAT